MAARETDKVRVRERGGGDMHMHEHENENTITLYRHCYLKGCGLMDMMHDLL